MGVACCTFPDGLSRVPSAFVLAGRVFSLLFSSDLRHSAMGKTCCGWRGAKRERERGPKASAAALQAWDHVDR